MATGASPDGDASTPGFRPWPFRGRPKPDELLSSWFLRAAEAMEMKPYALGHIAWRSTPPPLTRDIDGIADDRILAILSASTLTPIEQCRATTLASYEGVLFESHQPLGRTAWIMPLGVRARTRLSPGCNIARPAWNNRPIIDGCGACRGRRPASNISCGFSIVAHTVHRSWRPSAPEASSASTAALL